jgi:hypothetical protein
LFNWLNRSERTGTHDILSISNVGVSNASGKMLIKAELRIDRYFLYLAIVFLGKIIDE